MSKIRISGTIITVRSARWMYQGGISHSKSMTFSGKLVTQCVCLMFRFRNIKQQIDILWKYHMFRYRNMRNIRDILTSFTHQLLLNRGVSALNFTEEWNLFMWVCNKKASIKLLSLIELDSIYTSHYWSIVETALSLKTSQRNLWKSTPITIQASFADAICKADL